MTRPGITDAKMVTMVSTNEYHYKFKSPLYVVHRGEGLHKSERRNNIIIIVKYPHIP